MDVRWYVDVGMWRWWCAEVVCTEVWVCGGERCVCKLACAVHVHCHINSLTVETNS